VGPEQRLEPLAREPSQLGVPHGPDRGRARRSREQGQLPHQLTAAHFADHTGAPALRALHAEPAPSTR